MSNIRIAYYSRNESPISTLTHCPEDDLVKVARMLETTAPSWEDAKKYVHLTQHTMQEHWGVDGYGDPLCTQISGVKNTENLIGLFIHMRSQWHFSDNGIDWIPTQEEFPIDSTEPYKVVNGFVNV